MLIDKIKKNKYIAIAIAIGTIIIALASFFDAISKLISPLTKENNEIIVDCKLASYEDKDVQKYMNIWGDFRYMENPIGKVTPISNYLNGFYKDKFIIIPDLGYYEAPSFFSLYYPSFDLKIINNTNKAIVLDKITIDVESSKVDDKPLLYFYTAEDDNDRFCLSLINEGWMKWKNCSVKFNLNSTISSINNFNQNNSKFDYSVEIPYFENKHNIDLSPFLEKEGVDVNFLKEQIRKEVFVNDNNIGAYLNALGKFNTCKDADNYFWAFIEGNAVIENFNNDKYSFNFTGKVLLTTPELGGALDINDHFNLKLKTEGANYQVDYPISISLRPNEPERLLITIAADKSSIHKFKIKLGNINGLDIESKQIDLSLFFPRTSSQVSINK